MEPDLSLIFEHAGIEVSHAEPLRGGDSGRSWRLQTALGPFFLKVNDAAKYPGMFRLEAAGLDALRNHSALTVPRVRNFGEVGRVQYLLLEWLDRGRGGPITRHRFGTLVADMHRVPQSLFGWPEDNYIGNLAQQNAQVSTWTEFYAGQRVLPLVKLLADGKMIDAADLRSADIFCAKLDSLFPAEPPALLHGDLWSGNYQVTAKGPAVFDPAVYCGHREMDLAMTLLFGGFGDEFYRGYESAYPLEKGWRERLPYAQLYPLLVHAVLFGGAYTGNAMAIIRSVG